MAQRLSDALGHQVIVDNRPGAGGTIGTDIGARANPDGYTLIGGTNGPIAISPYLYEKLPYRPLIDLAPVTLYAIVPYAILAHPSVRANNVDELIALAKSKPGALRYASAGNGSAPAAIDVLSGQVQLYCPGLTSVIQHVKAGKMKPIVVTMAKRTQFLPDVSTSSEQGHPALQVNSWVGLLVPAKTPAAIVDRLHAEITKIMATAEMKTFVANTGAEPVALGPREFGEFLRGEYDKWGKVAKAAKLRIE